MKLLDLKTNQLLQMYANADKTCSCGGHHKGNMNESLRKEYALELEKRGLIVPKTLSDKFDDNFNSNIEIPSGIFNGEGTY